MADRTCSVSGCPKKVLARGWCSTHYRRWRTTGEVGTAELINKPVGSRICLVEGCLRVAVSNGMCGRHDSNARSRGYAIPRKEWSVQQRLDAVGWDVTDDGCWEWRGRRNDLGYALISIRNRTHRVHRLIYEETFGPIPDGLEVRHKCDNPPCSNPQHLELGSHSDNMRDMAERGRHWKHGRTECPNGHDLTAPRALKTVRTRGRKPYSTCVECERDRKRRWEERHAS